MNKSYFISLGDYNAWANQLVCEWLKEITEEQWMRPVISSFNSIYETALHIVFAEKIWSDRINQLAEPENMTKTFRGTKDDLCEKWKKVSQELNKIITGFPEASLNENLSYRNTKGTALNQPYWQVFAHIINHSTYHRGQLVTMLRQVGYTDLSSIDMVTYFRLKN